MIPTDFSHQCSHLGPTPLTSILAHSALYIAVLCHAFQLKYLKKPPDIAKISGSFYHARPGTGFRHRQNVMSALDGKAEDNLLKKCFYCTGRHALAPQKGSMPGWL